MNKIALIIGILIVGMVFEKNPTVGIIIIAIYIVIRFSRRKYNSNLGLIKSGEHNTDLMVSAVKDGFKDICETMLIFQDEYVDDFRSDSRNLNKKQYNEPMKRLQYEME